MLLHGWSSSADLITAESGLPVEAARAGWVVVVPEGSGSPSRWALPGRLDGPDDAAFVDAVIHRAASRFCLRDPAVALIGFSNGAAFAGHYACVRPAGAVDALVLVSGAGFTDPCERPELTVDMVHDVNDPVVPAFGGPVLGGRLAAAPLAEISRDWRLAGSTVSTTVVDGWAHRWPAEATEVALRRLRDSAGAPPSGR